MFKLSQIYNNILSLQRGSLSFASLILSFFYIRLYLILLIGLNLFIWLVAYYININVSQDLIVLHYNINFGVDLIGSVKKIFILPLLGLIIIIINVIIFFILAKHKDFKFFAHLLLGACVAVNIFLFISSVTIYLINFR